MLSTTTKTMKNIKRMDWMIFCLSISTELKLIYWAKSKHNRIFPESKYLPSHPITRRFNPGCSTDVKLMSLWHYNDAIMTTIASQITSLTVVYSTVYSDADQRKHPSSASLAFVWGIHRDRWIPRTKGQLRVKCFHLMTSSCKPGNKILSRV